MRLVAWGTLVGSLLVACLAFVSLPQAQAQRAGSPAPGSADLVALSFDAGEGRQQLAVLDPRSRVLAVYHVDRTSGSLALKSVRNVHWDLQMEEFNTTAPSPREIRSLTEQR